MTGELTFRDGNTASETRGLDLGPEKKGFETPHPRLAMGPERRKEAAARHQPLHPGCRPRSGQHARKTSAISGSRISTKVIPVTISSLAIQRNNPRHILTHRDAMLLGGYLS